MADADQEAIAEIVAKIDEVLGDDEISDTLRVRLVEWRWALADAWGVRRLQPI
jgi:hypothetical protein